MTCEILGKIKYILNILTESWWLLMLWQAGKGSRTGCGDFTCPNAGAGPMATLFGDYIILCLIWIRPIERSLSEFQSNSPFPTLNFNPRPPLVQYGSPPVFSAMSSQVFHTLVCSLEGDPLAKPYDLIDTLIDTNIIRLKAAIRNRIDLLHNVNADGLKLWKVVSLIPRACAFWLSLSAQCDGSYWSRW